MMRLEGKTALVTGGSRGIGAAIAKRLAAEGATVFVNYVRGAEAAEQVVAEIRAIGGTAVTLQGDISSPEDCEGLVSAVLESAPSMDILVNNAGVTRDGLLVRMSDEDFDEVIRVNLKGAFSMSRAAAKTMMKARSGSMINISSVVGVVGNAGQANYAAAKAGLIGMTRSIARELAPRGVRCNAVAPGFIETDMTAQLGEKVREAALAQVALQRFGSADDVAAAVAYLASDDAAYVTGQVLTVDGGMTFA